MTHDNPLRICLWSGPRNVSTALMYSFAQREDTRVIDEPLYAHYLRASGAPHPGMDEVMASMDVDGDRVVRQVMLGATDRPVLFMKQMAHHLLDLDLGFLPHMEHLLLIRDPNDMLRSLINQLPHPLMRDTGLDRQSRLFDELASLRKTPVVLDARELLADPRRVLSEVCSRLDISFFDSMLAWPPGPRPEDGVWAKHWYHQLHRSTGFGAYHSRSETLPAHVEPLLEDCLVHYRKLYAFAVRA